MTAQMISPIDFAGNPTKTLYSVVKENFTVASSGEAPTPSHHILILDCSGSMYYMLPRIKETLEKLFIAESFFGTNMKFSLITYSSRGDVVTHFERVDAEQLPNQVNTVKSLRTRGATCISQALRMAVNDLTDENELTAITLHSDGYANDPSFYSERSALVELSKNLSSNTFINTIAYGNWADFGLLNEIAGHAGGICFQLENERQVYDCVRDTSIIVSKASKPTYTIERKGGEILCVVSADSKVFFDANVNSPTFTMKGVVADSEYTLYRMFEFDPEASMREAASTSVECEDSLPYLALAKMYIALGNVERAKFVLNAFSGSFVKPHAKALVNSQIAAFSAAIDEQVENPTVPRTSPYLMNGVSVVDILAVLGNYNGILVDTKDLAVNYIRQGVKKLSGSRDKASGEFTENTIKTVYNESDRYLPIDDFVISRESATVNMRFKKGVTLMNAKSNSLIREVKGVKLDDLNTYQMYSVVSSGEVNVPSFVVRFDSPENAALSFFREIEQKENCTILETVDASNNEYRINLSEFPLIGFGQSYDIDRSTVESMINLRMIDSFLKELTSTIKGEDRFTKEQIEALKEIHVTPAMNISLPTTTPYVSLDDAITDGSIDIIPEYKVKVGLTSLVSSSDLDSANKCFDRHYTVNGQKGCKVAELLTFDKSASIERKAYSKATKLNSKDDLMTAVYDVLLGIQEGDLVDMSIECLDSIRSRIYDKSLLLKETAAIHNKVKDIWQRLMPVTFYIGATGSIPNFNESYKVMDFESFSEAYPLTPMKKEDKEARFLVFGSGVVLTITESTKYVSRNADSNEEE